MLWEGGIRDMKKGEEERRNHPANEERKKQKEAKGHLQLHLGEENRKQSM